MGMLRHNTNDPIGTNDEKRWYQTHTLDCHWIYPNKWSYANERFGPSPIRRPYLHCQWQPRASWS